MNDKLPDQYRYEKVEWQWTQGDPWWTISATVAGITTKRMFRIREGEGSEREQVMKEALKAQQDVVDRFEFMHKVRLGLLNTSEIIVWQ